MSGSARVIRIALAAGAIVASAAQGGAAVQDAARREIELSAKRYAFQPARIEVTQDDLVRVSFSAVDIPHSFTIDGYRIAKRATPGHPVVFEFRADQAGVFPFYCDLKADDGCKNTRGELIVRRR